jgi:hypothetical protein
MKDDPFKNIYLQCPECNQLYPFRKIVTGKYWWPEKEKHCPDTQCEGFYELNEWDWYIIKNNILRRLSTKALSKELIKITRWNK